VVVVVLVLALGVGAAGASAAPFAVVANSGDNTASGYDATSGALTATTPVATGSRPVGVAVSPDGKSVYVTDYGGGSVSQFDVGAGGTLAAKSPATVATGNAPHDVAVSPDGRSVYVTNANDDTVSQFDVGAGGTLAAKSPATVATGSSPLGIATRPAVKVPTVSSVRPASGPVSGGTSLTITGSGFQRGAAVEVGQGPRAAAIPATNVKVVSPTQITATTGGSAKPGSWSLFVTEAGATSAANSGARFVYTPLTVSRVSPRSGPVTGGTAITITGTGFARGATTVEIGQGSGAGPSAIPATNVKVVSATQITATTGGSAKPGNWHVFVIYAGRPSAATSADRFAYIRVRAASP
jgi:YVTN family beta-propeller protein